MKNTLEPAQYLINQKGYTGIYPPFHNPSEFDWVKSVEQQWEIIRDELFSNSQFVNLNAPHVKGNDGWKGIYLLNFTWTKHYNCRKFPLTIKILEVVPHLTFAAFSMLEPGASLQPHWGDTNTIIRCHLGIEIPEPAPLCALQVANELKGWQNGKIIMFSECHLHSAWNKSDKRRIILSFDTMRNEFEAEKNIICSRVLAAETLFFLDANFKWLSLLLKQVHKPAYWIIAAIWYIYLPIQRRCNFLP